MTEERILLDSWICLGYRAQEWQENFHKLKLFIEWQCFGARQVSDNWCLGVSFKAEEEKGELTGEKSQLLDSWICLGSLEQNGRKNFASSSNILLTGNALVSNHPVLGRWVQRQRDKKNGTLSDKRIQLLEEIGFIWKVC